MFVAVFGFWVFVLGYVPRDTQNYVARTDLFTQQIQFAVQVFHSLHSQYTDSNCAEKLILVATFVCLFLATEQQNESAFTVLSVATFRQDSQIKLSILSGQMSNAESNMAPEISFHKHTILAFCVSMRIFGDT